MRKLLLFLVVIMAVAVEAVAQQRPQYSQYMINNFLLNPAVTGIEDYADIRVSNRRQWMGLDGAPVTYYISGHTSLNKGTHSTKYKKALAHHGAGFLIHTDKTGPLRRTGVTGSYAYHLPVTRSINVSAGVSTGIISNSLNSSELDFKNDSDPLLGSGNLNHSMLDLGLGFWIYSNDFSIGISGSQLLADAAGFSRLEGGQPELGLQRHYFVSGRYRFSPTSTLDVIPSVMVKLASPSPVAVDASVRVLYDERFWVGTTYRHKDALVGMVGVYVNPLLDISYSYDATISNINRVSTGTHEIVLGFKIMNERRIICPQWVW
ncbi:PorP/SprF family type IX secretion system membrane protein [Botryobacter ruber]|uniref:PorP/SprF family type IX secretion system membrane protein n=1 Tax=Botryobacter ruber TaxID=2171629 RepID=UPI000E0C2EAB|nr:type IX secretion system membrane protein PorP/SprF [Botryobacter ruber]